MSALAAKEAIVTKKRYAERPVLTLPGGRDVFRLTPPERDRLERAMRFYYAWRDGGGDVWNSGAQRTNFPHPDRIRSSGSFGPREPGKLVQDDTSHYLRIERTLDTLLDREQRDMLRWRYVDNLQYKQIAKLLNVPLDRLELWWREATVKLYYAIHPDLS